MGRHTLGLYKESGTGRLKEERKGGRGWQRCTTEEKGGWQRTHLKVRKIRVGVSTSRRLLRKMKCSSGWAK